MDFPHDISKYQLLEQIGCGGTSKVYSAVCLSNNKELAIKIIDLEENQIELEFLYKEVSFWSSSQHPNIVSYYGSFTAGSVIYILMEYLSYGSLHDIMRYNFSKGFHDEIQMSTMLKGVISALQYIHSSGQLHRDIKPGNVLLGYDGSVKIGDFGVAASLLEQGQRKRARYTVIGTPCYMAPEVFKETNGYTQKADIWSLGITAFELATGEAPYCRLHQMDIVQKIMSMPPPELPQSKFSPEFRDFVSMCLQTDPQNRPKPEQLLVHPFILRAKDKVYLADTILKSLPPIGKQLKTIETKKTILHQSLSFDSVEKPQIKPPSWEFPIEEKVEVSEKKGRFMITKNTSSNLVENKNDKEDLEKQVVTLSNIVIKLQSEMDETKAQLRIITKTLQDLMSKL